MADKEIEEMHEEEVKVKEEGDDVVDITPKGKRKKSFAKTEKKTRV